MALLVRQPGNRLVVAFTAHRTPPGRYGFYSHAPKLGGSVLYLRDDKDSWYNAGIEGVGHDVAQIADHIRRTANDVGATTIVTVGSSMGGYAALLFGALLDAERCVAFAPQTLLKKGLPHYPADDSRLEYPDLADLAPNSVILVGEDNLTDHFHAYRIGGDVQVFPGAAHTFSEQLAAEGILGDVLAQAVEGGRHPVMTGACPDRQLVVDAMGAFHFGGGSEGLELLVGRFPGWAGARHYLGRMLLDQDPGRAGEQFASAIRLRPGWYEPYRFLGEALLAQDRPEDALEPLEAAVAMRPGWGLAHFHLARCFEMLGRQETAERHYREAHAIEPWTVVTRQRQLVG